MRRSLPAIAAVALVALALQPASAVPYATTTVVQVSGATPLSSPPCSDLQGAGTVEPGKLALYENSEVEPWVDVSPADPDIVAGIWQQDRWFNGGARANVGAVSTDGGATWQEIRFPGVTQCDGGDFDRASDPWVSFSPNGDLHIMHLVLDIETVEGKPGGFGPNGMMVQKIPAAAFADDVIDVTEISDPILIAFEDNGEDLHDKNSLTADPFDSNFAYAVWDFLDLPAGAAINPDRGVFGGGLGFKGAALFSRTTDGGETWSEPKVLYNPGGVNQTIGNQIVVDDEGVLYDFFNEILNFRSDDGGQQFEFNLSFKQSSNRGATWEPRGRPNRIAKIVDAPVRDPDTGEPHRTADVLFDVASDLDSGALYAVWQDRRFTGRSAIAFIMSTDGGTTWSTPVMINQTPLAGNQNDQAFLPSVHVADDGTVGVTYYDFRNNTLGAGGTDTDHWFVHCHPDQTDCSDPANWDAEVHVDGPFDARQAPFARGFFLGDYVGLDNAGATFTPFFTQTTGADPANQHYAEVSP
jgi:hypothetical protein